MKTFGEAIEAAKRGERITRAGWNGRGMWVRLVQPASTRGAERRPYLEMKDAQGYLVPWLASQTDILAEDWMITPGA